MTEPRFINYWCGCDPATDTLCPEGRRCSSDKRGWMFTRHACIAEVCLGRRVIEGVEDIPQLPTNRYEVDVEWGLLLHCVAEHERVDGLDLLPVFQRGHVWTEAQQVAYVEAMLMGVEVSRTLIFNHYEWEYGHGSPPYPKGTMAIIDGLQRLTAVSRFMRDEITAFGKRLSEFQGRLRFNNARFKFRVLCLPDEAAVIRMYLALNAGGTPHTAEEIERVKALLKKETTS